MIRTIAIRTSVLGASLVLTATMLTLAGLPPLEVAAELLTGWVSFLARSCERMQFNAAGAATAAVCLLVLFTGGHLSLRWLTLHVRGAAADANAKSPWSVRSTVLLVAVVVLMFVAGISFVGAAHQAAWLATADEPLTVQRLRWWRWEDQSDENAVKNQLREIRDGVAVGLGGFGNLHDDEGNALHSWQTRILPLLGFLDTSDRDLPWDHPRNIVHFEFFVPQYLSPAVGQLRTAEGLAVSHYAGNVHVFGDGDMTRGMIESQGASHTILAGEAAGNFKCWGDPANLRDPELGLHASPDGYGGHYGEETLFVFLDGSVRSVAADVDPQVLAAMSGRRAPPP